MRERKGVWKLRRGSGKVVPTFFKQCEYGVLGDESDLPRVREVRGRRRAKILESTVCGGER